MNTAVLENDENPSAIYDVAKGEEGKETHQNQIAPLVGGQEGVIIPVRRHPLQDDSCGPRELNKAPLVIPILRVLFAGLPCEFRGAQPMLEALIWIPKVLARLLGELGNSGRTSLPLYTSIPGLSPLSISIRISSVPIRTRLARRSGVSGAGANDLDGAWLAMIVGGILLLLVLLLWRLMVRLRSELVVVTRRISVWGMAGAHCVGRIDHSDSPLSCCDAPDQGLGLGSVGATCPSILDPLSPRRVKNTTHNKHSVARI